VNNPAAARAGRPRLEVVAGEAAALDGEWASDHSFPKALARSGVTRRRPIGDLPLAVPRPARRVSGNPGRAAPAWAGTPSGRWHGAPNLNRQLFEMRLDRVRVALGDASWTTSPAPAGCVRSSSALSGTSLPSCTVTARSATTSAAPSLAASTSENRAPFR
jgi:hypothetical protein